MPINKMPMSHSILSKNFNCINSANPRFTTEVILNNGEIQSYKSCSFHQNILQLNIPTPRSMKLVLFAITALHFANFGEVQSECSPRCDCAFMWTRKEGQGLLGFSRPVGLGKLAKKIIQTLDNDGCFHNDDLETMWSKSFNNHFWPIISD